MQERRWLFAFHEHGQAQKGMQAGRARAKEKLIAFKIFFKPI